MSKLAELMETHSAAVYAFQAVERRKADERTLDRLHREEWKAFVALSRFDAKTDTEFFTQAEYVRRHLARHYGRTYADDTVVGEELDLLLARVAGRYLARRAARVEL